MDHLGVSVLLCTVLLILDGVHGGVNVQHFSSMGGKKLLGHSVAVTHAVSRIKCCAKCAVNPVCRAANFNPTTGECQLCDETPEKYGTVVEVNAEWNLYHVKGPCGDSWIYYGPSCYKFEPFENTWAGSTDHCATFGARLVEIDDYAENQFVVNVSASAGLGSTWLGVNDIATNGVFVLPSGPPASYLNFNTNEGTSDREGCVILSPTATTWADVKCNRYEHIVCEKELL